MEKRRSNLRILMCMTVLLIFPNVVYGLYWPLGSGTWQKEVNATFGEYRPATSGGVPYNTPHFHDGVDIIGSAGNVVWGVEDERVDVVTYKSESNRHVRTHYHDFFHIDPDNNLAVGDTAWPYVRMGYILAAYGHVHLTVEEDQTLYGTYGYEYNPLLQSLGPTYALQPFSDTHYPQIDSINVVKNGTTQEFPDNVIKDSVDILVFASDTTSYPDGFNTDNGVYKIECWIEPVWIYFPIIQFDCWTWLWEIDTVYAPGSNMSTYVYVATHDMFWGGFWDTHEVDDGFYWVMVQVCDQSNNCVTSGLPVYVYNVTRVDGEDAEESKPSHFFLHQNRPNPFNPETKISYDIPRKERVKITVYNILGGKVKMLRNKVEGPGRFSVSWDGTDMRGHEVASGIYFCRMEAAGFTEVRKIALIR